MEEPKVKLSPSNYSENDLSAGDWRGREENRKDEQQKHNHKLARYEFLRETIFLSVLLLGSICLATISQEPTVRAAGMSVFSGVSGAVIRSFGANSMKKIVDD